MKTSLGRISLMIIKLLSSINPTKELEIVMFRSKLLSSTNLLSMRERTHLHLLLSLRARTKRTTQLDSRHNTLLHKDTKPTLT